jgi:Bacterial protein of unknown function (DUF937)
MLGHGEAILRGETMAANLIGMLEQLLGSSEVLSRLGSLIGLSPERTKTAVGAAVPAILAALVGLVQKPAGRDQLATAVRNQDPGVLDNLSGMLSGGREKSLIDSGNNALTSLFGRGQVGGLAGALGRFAGLSEGSATSLLGALAPVVLGALGREQRTQGLDGGQGLARLLNDQKDSIAHALPSGLASELGATGLLEGISDRLGEGVSPAAEAARTARADAARTASVAASTAGATTTAARQRTAGGSSWLRWLIGLIVLLVLIWLAWQYLFRDRMEEAVAPTTPPATVGEPAQNLVVGDVNLGQEVTNVFESATATLNDVTDAASAEAALPRLTEINTNLDRLGGLVGQLPAEGKSALAALVNGALPELEALIARVTEIAGVGAVIKPATDALVEKLRAMAA